MRPSHMLLTLGLLLAGCGGGSLPTNPGPVTPPPSTSTSWTITGQLTATSIGTPIGGATLTIGNGLTATTGTDGRFTVSGSGAPGAAALTIAGGGVLTRRTMISAFSRDVAIDAISTAAPFSADLWREMVFDGKDSPGTLYPIQRWSTAPRFYIVTKAPDGSDMLPAEIARITETITRVVPQWTAGAYQADVSSGRDDPGSPSGTVVIRFVASIEGDHDGLSTIGTNPGSIQLRYPSSVGCPRQNSKLQQGSVAHEVGHALGFFHHNGAGLLGVRDPDCTAAPNLSDVEAHHARLAYSRPRGTSYPDDAPPSSLFSLRPSGLAVAD